MQFYLHDAARYGKNRTSDFCVPKCPKRPEMSQNISSLALVCVHMHTRAHVASLNSGQYKV